MEGSGKRNSNWSQRGRSFARHLRHKPGVPWCEYKATFTLREDTNPKQLIAVVTDCPFPQYVGKTSQAIYRIENGTLTLAANEPGNPAVPANFDAPNARVILFKVK
jgi:uncharacterized protein (TIGR03067 family)